MPRPTIASLKSDLAELRQAHDVVVRERDHQRDQTIALSADKARLLTQVKALQEANEKGDDELVALSNTRRNRIDELERGLALARRKGETDESAIKLLRAEIQSERNDNTQLRTECARLDRERTSLQGRLNTAGNALADIRDSRPFTRVRAYARAAHASVALHDSLGVEAQDATD